MFKHRYYIYNIYGSSVLYESRHYTIKIHAGELQGQEEKQYATNELVIYR